MKNLVNLLVLVPLFAACTSNPQNVETGDTISNNSEHVVPGDEAPPASPTGPGKADSLLTCEGAGNILFSDTPASLEQKVGKTNIKSEPLVLEGNVEGQKTHLWKGQEKELIIYWKESKAPYRTISMIEVSHRNSPWKFANGVKVGMNLDELVKLNGNTAISFYGFGWDYGGTFINFNEGKLATDIPCFGGVFIPDGKNRGNALSGDKPLRSDQPDVRKTDIRLEKLRLMNPES